MKNNPTGAMGVPDYLGWNWKSSAGLPVVCIPGCPAQPDNMTETLMYLVFHLAGHGAGARARRGAAAQVAVRAHRARGLQPRRLRGGGQLRHGERRRPRCLVKLGCKGPVVKCNVPVRGWSDGKGGCPNVGGICMACTMPGFPDKYMPFMDEDPLGDLAATGRAFTYGPGPALLPPPEHQEQVRQGARVEHTGQRADNRLPKRW